MDTRRVHERDFWEKLSFFLNPSDLLEDKTPLEVLHSGEKIEEVIQAVKAYGEHGALGMFNPPPADLSSRIALIYVPSDSTICYRSHQMSKAPLYFGLGMMYRWDAPAAEYGVLYLASDPLQKDPRIIRVGRHFLFARSCRWYSTIRGWSHHPAQRRVNVLITRQRT